MYFETPIAVKDVEFMSYVLPHEENPHGILHMTFRLPHMEKDIFLIEIKKDENNRLFSKYITYLEENHEDVFGPMFEVDEEEHSLMLKAVVNDPQTQFELSHYEFGEITDVYAVHEHYEIILHHCDLDERVGPHNEPKSLEIEVFSFSEKEEAFAFYQKVFREYAEKSYDYKHHSFGAFKYYWENEDNQKDTLTYALFMYKGEEIMTEQEYQSLDNKAMDETILKDVEFDSYYPKQEKVEETLFLSFRTKPMFDDEFVISILKDQQGNLYSDALLFFDAEEKETYNVSDEYDESVILSFLQDVLKFTEAQKELQEIGWDISPECYVALR